jgi:hypothetical protein
MCVCVCRISVAGKKFIGQTELKEAWYGTEYSVTKLSEQLIQVSQQSVLSFTYCYLFQRHSTEYAAAVMLC